MHETNLCVHFCNPMVFTLDMHQSQLTGYPVGTGIGAYLVYMNDN
jgi:hypothetical protein